MLILLTCLLAAGFVFTPPEGYVLDKVEGPPKREKNDGAACPNCTLWSDGTTIMRGEPPAEKVKLTLRQTGKASSVFDLPPGCSGESTSVTFRAK